MADSLVSFILTVRKLDHGRMIAMYEFFFFITIAEDCGVFLDNLCLCSARSINHPVPRIKTLTFPIFGYSNSSNSV